MIRLKAFLENPYFSIGFPSADKFSATTGELFLDSKSGVTFILLGRYSVVRVIPH